MADAFDQADSGTYYTPESIKQKRRLAEAMLAQGMDTSPIRSNTQGLARLLQAALGGYGVYKADQQEQNGQKAMAGMYQSLLSPGGAASTPSAPSTPATGVAPTSTPSITPDTSDFKTFVQGQEGFNPRPYGDYKQTSIGYGTRAQPGDTNLSQDEASKRLDVELGKARMLVQATYPGLSKPQEDALTDLTFNSGTDWMKSGLGQAVKQGNWDDAQRRFEQYVNADGKPLQGLINRRRAMSGNLTDQGSPDIETPFGKVTAPGTEQAPADPTAAAAATTKPAGAAAASTDPAVQKANAGITSSIPPETRRIIGAMLSNPATYQTGATLMNKIIGDSISSHEMGLTPIYGVDGAGNPIIMQLSKHGGAQPVQMPSGVTPSKAPIKIDTGTGTVLVDPITKQPINEIKKDIVGKESAEEIGKAQGKATTDLPRIRDNTNAMLQSIDAVRKDPWLDNATGVLGLIPGIPGYSKDFTSKVDQLTGQSFLQAYNSLRGGGAITDIEGAKATNAIARLQRTQSPAEFRNALDELEGVVKGGLARAQEMAKTGGRDALQQAQDTKTIGGKTYTKINGQWFEQ